MSVHHLDVLRFLFGDPDEITTLARKDPRTDLRASRRHHGLDAALSRPGVLAVSLEDVWSGPREDGYRGRHHIKLARRGHRRASPRARSAGRPRRPPSTLTLRLDQDHRRRMGAAELGHDVVPARLHRRDGAAAARASTPARAPALSVADNVKTMALVEAGYRSMAEGRTVKLVRNSSTETDRRQGGHRIMMQAGIFTGYFPYGLDGDGARRSAASASTRCSSTCISRMSTCRHRARSPATRPSRSATTFRDHNLPICCVSGYTNIIHPDQAEREQRRRLSQGDHPQRAPFRLALRDLRDRHLQHRIRLGASPARTRPRKASRSAARSSPTSPRPAYDHGAVFLLETYVNNVVGSVEETVRMFAAGRPSGPRPADGPDQLFRDAQHRQHGPDPEPGLRHADRQDQDRARQGRQACRAPTSRRSTPTSATRTRWRATPSAASARSSCRRRASAR